MDWSYRGAVQYWVLGPLRVSSESGAVEVRGVKERVLLALLLASAGRVVPVADLVDGLWGESPPRSAAKSLQTYVLRLRNALEPGRDGPARVLVTEASGYRLVADPRHVDASRFTRLLSAAEQGSPQDRLDLLGEALGLWRGAAFAGLGSPRLAAEAARLEELRLVALERRHAAEVELGRTAGAVAELERLVAEHPLRERFWALLATGLYREGRQGDALGALARARAVLADQLGVDPGAELRRLHELVLAQDPGLGAPRVGAPLPQALAVPTAAVHGREEELAVLRAARGTVLVRGPVGAGARTLARVVAHEVAAAGGRVRHVGHHGPDPDDDSPVDLLVVDRGAARCGPAATRTLLLGAPGTQPPPGATVVDLGPLPAHTVRALVAGFVSGDDLDAATEQVTAVSGGWPGAARAAAVDYVRAAASAYVGAAATDVGRSGAALQEARARIASGVLDLQEVEAAGGVDPERCPWPGLAAYDVGDGDWFAGRERLVAELLARVAGASCLAVVGASGSGKSSAVRAGLLVGLAADRLPGSAVWDHVVLRPGAHPMRELAQRVLGTRHPEPGEVLQRLLRSTDRPGAEARTVLVVDQLEEAWSTCTDAGERAAFLDTLGDLATDRDRGVTVVAVVRSDYVDRLADHEVLATALGANTVLVGTPTAADVRRAVERPARRGGVVLDDGLTDALVADAGDEPGLLPLLSTALAQLWERRDGHRLTFDAYVALGGVAGAIAHLAEQVHEDLDETSRESTRRVLLRLAGPGVGAAVTRRRVPVAELAGLPGADVRAVVERLAEDRLLALSEDHVEVAHEALYREWPRLRTWLAEDAAGRAVQRRLAVAAAEWQDERRDPVLLWRGSRLDAGLEVAAARPDEVTLVERAFLDESRDAAEADRRATEARAEREARQNRRLRRVLGGTSVLLVLALVAGALALLARDEAARAARAADARRLAATALSQDQPDLALLTAVESTRLEQGPATYGALLTLLARQPDVVTRHRTQDRFLRNATTPDGKVVLLGENVPVLRAVDARTGDLLWAADLPAQVGDVATSPDGRSVAVTSLTGDGGRVLLLDTADGSVQWRFGVEDVATVAPSTGRWLWPGLGWHPDGRLAVATDTHVVLAGRGGTVREAVPWGRPVPGGGSFLVWPDGRVSAGSVDPGEAGQVVDLGAPDAPPGSTAGNVVAVSPDGQRAAEVLTRRTGTLLRLLDTRSLRPSSPAWPLDDVVLDGAFSPDGRRLALGVAEEVLVRDARTGAPVDSLAGHSGAVMAVSYAGSRRLWTAGRDGSAVAFDTTGAAGVIGTTSTRDAPASGERSPDSGHAAWVEIDEDGPNRAVLRPAGADRGRPLPLPGLGCRCQATGTDLTTDGTTVLAGYHELGQGFSVVPDSGHVVVWDATSRRVVASVATPWPVNAVAAVPGTDRAVVSGTEGWAVMDVSEEALVGVLDLPRVDPWFETTSLAEVAPDGRRAALLRGDEVVLVDVGTGAVLSRRTLGGAVGLGLSSAAFTRDGEDLAVGSTDGWLHLLDGSSLRPTAPRRLITGGFVLDVEVSPDGRMAATLGTDGDTVLWDTSTWQPFGQRVVDGGGWGFLAFDEGPDRLSVESELGHRTTVRTDPAAWVAAACAAANRELTTDEVAVVLPGSDTDPACGG